MFSNLALLSLSLALAGAPESPAAAPKQRLLVLDFKAADADRAIGSTLGDVVATECARDGRFEVVTSKDLRAFLEKEAARTELGCDTSSGSCLAELAGALGASLVAYGEANRLGEVLIVAVNVFDADKGVSVGRETFELQSDRELPGAVRRAMARLLRPNETPLADALLWVGGVLGGAGVVAAMTGMVGAFLANEVQLDPQSSGADKAGAGRAHVPLSVTAALGATVAVAGGVLVGLSLGVSE